MEPVILTWFNKEKGLALKKPEKQKFEVSKGKTIEICLDGLQEDGKICHIVEIYARRKPLKAGNTNKITKDILKMIFYEKLVGKKYKKYFIVANSKIKQKFDRGKSWLAALCAIFEIGVCAAELTKSEIQKIEKAQTRQGKSQKRISIKKRGKSKK